VAQEHNAAVRCRITGFAAFLLPFQERKEMSEEQERQEENQTQVSSEIESKAREMGWVPKEEFKGNPERWRGADEYVRRGEEMLPIMKKANQDLRRELSDVKQALTEAKAFWSKSEERAYQRALDELQKEKEKAFEDGDRDAFKAIEKKQMDLVDEKMKAAPPKQPDDAGYVHPDFVEWKRSNSWYDNDRELRLYADSVGQYLAAAKGMEYGEILKTVAQKVKQEFPEKFRNSRRDEPSSVASGSSTSGAGRSGAKGYGDLPAEAKAMCDRFERTGVMKRDEYLKQYQW